jgi:hypothetical protein
MPLLPPFPKEGQLAVSATVLSIPDYVRIKMENNFCGIVASLARPVCWDLPNFHQCPHI